MSVTLSERAANEVKRMMAQQQLPQSTLLRVAVIGGGCSGYEYKLDFIPQADEKEDQVAESHGVRVAVDQRSVPYLAGMEIDCGEGLNNRGFLFKNPLALRTCGCGTSFSI